MRGAPSVCVSLSQSVLFFSLSAFPSLCLPISLCLSLFLFSSRVAWLICLYICVYVYLFLFCLNLKDKANSTESYFNCTSSFWAVNSSNDQCTGEPYVGGACSDSLLTWQECILGQTEEAVMVGVKNNSQGQLNSDINKTLATLSLLFLFYEFLLVNLISIAGCVKI